MHIENTLTEINRTHATSGIYLIQNSLNGRIYIGQSKNIYRRWLSHCESSSARNSSAIDKAIQKYGKANFKCFLLELIEESSLNEREFYWAECYPECYVPCGYNIQICGATTRNLLKMTAVSSYDDTGKIVSTFNSMSDAVAAHGNGVMWALKPNNGAKKGDGLYWRRGTKPYIDIENLERLKTGPNGGKITYRYDFNTGEYIDSFKSTCDAAKILQNSLSIDNAASSNIQSAAAGKLRSAYGYYWAYDKVNNILAIRPHLKDSTNIEKWKMVSQYDLKGTLIQTYPNQLAASKAVRVGAGSITSAIKGKQKTCRGFYWRNGNASKIIV